MDQEFHGAPGFGYIVYWRRYKPSSVYDALWRKVRLGILLHVLHDIYNKLYIFLTISNIASSNQHLGIQKGGGGGIPRFPSALFNEEKMYCLAIIWEKYSSWSNSKTFLSDVITSSFQEGPFEDWTKDRLTVQVGEENYYLEYEIKIQVYNVMGKGPNSTEAVVYSAEGSKY